MALTIDINFSAAQCKVIVTVADTDNSGQPGTITLVRGNSAKQVKPVPSVTATPLDVDFDAPKDGLIHQFTATLVVGSSQTSLTQYLQVCTAAAAADVAEAAPEEEEQTDQTAEEQTDQP
ncbi:hypothetical protein [Emticicia sp. TH156]|uniref:hypothetical protein n=1 Tax=Emticicia sp. TH156 TaxID=2067454 RepID=UPI000C75BFFB|nr:hypothetical protein [Emticicia sp. TH156]PLK44433.1 hypothetical protein C0V77_11660 [Emticicia sp. TH156]